MRSPSRLLVAVSAALVLAACSHGGGAGPQPAAVVDGTRITNAQVAREAQLFTFLAGLNRAQCGNVAAGETQQQACNRFSLGNLIQGVFVNEYADQHQVTVADQDVASVLAQLDTGVGKSKVDQALASNKLTRDDLHALAEQVLLFEKVQKDLVEAKTSDTTLRQLYQQQILSFTTLNVEHILVKTKEQAEQIYQEVTKPGATEATFQALARKDSIDKGSAQRGGALGSTPASRLVAPFAEAAAALSPGEISKPVHTQFGWHVIRLIDKSVTPFDQARTQLLQSQAPTVFDAWLKTQVSTRSVDVNPSFGRYDVATLSVVPISSTDASAGSSPSSSP